MSKLNLTPLHLGDILTEGGGAFGPTSFEGYPIEAAFTLHRNGSHPPTEDQQERMILSLSEPNSKKAMSIQYTVSLWVKFHVTNVLDPADWDSPDCTFEHTWSLGGKSAALWYVCDQPDVTVPRGLKGGFEHQALLATGWYEDAKGKHVLWLDGDDLSVYRGRWFQGLPNVPEAKRKLNSKSGFAVMCLESAPVVAAVDPSLVSSRTELDEKTKEAKVVQFLDYWLPTPGELDSDGDPVPYGARYFLGLNGIWDTKPVGTFQRKGEKEAQTQKVLCLTTFTGRVAVSSVAAGAGTTSKKTTKPASTSTTQSASTVAVESAPAPAVNGSGSLESRIKAMIVSLLPTEKDETTGRFKGVQSTPFKLTVFKTGKEKGVWANDQEVSKQGLVMYEEILKAAPSPEDAAIIGAPDGFVFNPAQKVVERWEVAE